MNEWHEDMKKVLMKSGCTERVFICCGAFIVCALAVTIIPVSSSDMVACGVACCCLCCCYHIYMYVAAAFVYHHES